MGQTWKDTGRTVLTEGYGGRQSDLFNSALGISDEQFDQSLDDTFGPRTLPVPWSENLTACRTAPAA